jgi:parallel beta-helix repeat protein
MFKFCYTTFGSRKFFPSLVLMAAFVALTFFIRWAAFTHPRSVTSPRRDRPVAAPANVARIRRATTCAGEHLEERRLLTAFYVDTNNPAASDSNAGTINAPLKTITQALNLASNNNATSQSDTIFIRGGVYHEQPDLWTSDSGASATDRTVISAYVNPTTGKYEPVYIDAADPTTGTWIEDGTSNRWYLNNFTTETSGVWVDWSPTNDGASLQQIGGYNAGYYDNRVLVGSGISDMVPGSYYGDIADSRLYVWLADGSNPNLHTIEYANRAREFYQPGTPNGNVYTYANYVDFVGLNLRHDNVYDNTGQDVGCAIYTEGDQRLINCDIEWNGGVGVFLRGNSEMLNCVSSHNGQNGVVGQGNDFLICGGQYDYNYLRQYLDGSNSAIKVISNSPTLYGSIVNIEAAYNLGKGIWFDTCFENSVVSDITGNYIHDNQDCGIDIEASRNFLIANNVIVRNGADGIALNAAENVDIYNNTLVGNYGIAAIELDGGTRDQGSAYPGTVGMLNNSIENNIIANNFTDFDLDVPTSAAGNAQVNNNTSDFNVFYRRGGSLKFTTGGTYLGWGQTPANLSDWQTDSGQDAHSIVADPLFLSGGSGALAYQLGSNSPARNVGANLSATLTTDYARNARPLAAFDVGAFQYVSSGTGTAGPIIANTDPTVWVDDQVPDNATMTNPDNTGNTQQNRFWLWNSSTVYSGAASLDSTVVSGTHRQYFLGANPRSIGANDILFAYLWIDPANLPQQVMLEWQDSGGSWNHAAYWGQNSIGTTLDGSTGMVSLGAIPTAGQWVRFAVPAATVGLAGKSVVGFSFDLYNGRALIDKIGNVNNAATLTGSVYQDNNGNGIFDSGESGLGGRTVFLDLNNDGVTDPGDPSAVTNSSGGYLFSSLSEGTYTVGQVLPAGFVSTITNSTAVPAIAGAVTTENLGEFPSSFTSVSNTDNFIAALSADGTRVQLWENAAESASPTYSVLQSQLTQLAFHTGNFQSSVTIDFSNGAPLSSGAITFDGGTGVGTFAVIGSPVAANVFNVSAGAVGVNGVSINVTQAASISVTGGSGSDSLTQLAANAPVSFIGGGGSDVLNINAGNYTFSSDPQPATSALSVNVADSASVTFATGSPGSGIQSFHLAGLNISSGGTVMLGQADVSSDRSVLVVNSLSFAGTSLAPQGELDLSNNDLIVRNGNVAAINNDLAGGVGGGAAGIVSTVARADTAFLTAVGFYTGSSMPFDGQAVSPADVLVKYTYYGDANLDGKVDASDYSRLDNGALIHLTGWFNGDFNYDGVVNGSDYTLMDNAFNCQGAVVAAQIATPDAASSAIAVAPSPTADQKKKPRMYIRGSDDQGDILDRLAVNPQISQHPVPPAV